jgi:hypothetical protein
MQQQVSNRAAAICTNYANAKLLADAGVDGADLDLSISVQEAKWLGMSQPDADLPSHFADKQDLADAWYDGVDFATQAALEETLSC